VNSKGEITLPACLLTLFLTCLLLIITLHSLRTYNAIKTRSKTYLCYREQSFQLTNYIRTISDLNVVIKYATLGKLIPHPIVAKTAGLTIKYAKAHQQISHFSYLKKITNVKRCSWSNKIFFLKNTPYKTKLGKLERDLKGTTIVRTKKWINYINSRSHSETKQWGFILQIKYSLKNQYQNSIFPKIKEFPMTKEMWKSNFVFGLPQSFSFLQQQ
jgi:hypothetical protein